MSVNARDAYLSADEIRAYSKYRDRVEACARAAHEANRAYCLTIGDATQQSWEAAEEWQRDSAVRGVKAVLNGATPEQSHEVWCRDKIADGWQYGLVKDAGKKEHPCLVPYEQLPDEQKRKDAIYVAVVHAMAQALDLR